jgi:hypothetical protein
MKMSLIALSVLFLASCVGGTLRSKNEYEEYPLRQASPKEGKLLKRCLLAAYEAQLDLREKTGEYYRRARDLPIGNKCDDLQVGQKFTADGFEIIAQFHEGESTVRWSVNQDKVVEEHYEEAGNDLEFGL